MKTAMVLALIVTISAGSSGVLRPGMPVRTTSFDSALAVPPTTAEQWSALGKAFHDAGRYRDAAAAYQRVMQLDKRASADAARNVARAYAELGNTKQAARWLEHARQLAFTTGGNVGSNIAPLRVE